MLCVVGLWCCGEALVGPSSLRSRLTVGAAKTRGESAEDELERYWAAHGAKWKRPCEMLDVRAAWNAGELDGIMPSGRESRQSKDRMISVARALELYDEDKLSVRRRFRNSKPEELLPRWKKICARRASLQEQGGWATAVVESEKRRDFQRALIEGEVESADASPAASRAVASMLSPALKAAAKQRNKADGGVLSAMAALQETAGDDVDERWLTAALLADLEAEVSEIEARDAPRQTSEGWASHTSTLTLGVHTSHLGVTPGGHTWASWLGEPAASTAGDSSGHT